MASASSATAVRSAAALSAPAPSLGPRTRSQSRLAAGNDSAVSLDVFGKDVSATDHVSEIDSLLKKRHAMLDERRKLQKELRNAQKRRQRLKRKAKELSQEDLVAVLLMREQEDAKKRKAGEKETPAPEEAEEPQPAKGVGASLAGHDSQEVEEESPSG